MPYPELPVECFGGQLTLQIAHLKEQVPEIVENIRPVIPFMLDTAAVELGPRSGYTVLAQHPNLRAGHGVLTFANDTPYPTLG